jgi:hypothetical protein
MGQWCSQTWIVPHQTWADFNETFMEHHRLSDEQATSTTTLATAL